MAPRSRGMERLFSAAVSSARSSSQQICRSCRQAAAVGGARVFSRREYASAATAAGIPSPSGEELASTGAAAAAAAAEQPIPKPNCIVKAGILLSRPPLITPDQHPFETAYLLYQRRLNERLVLPFTQYLYYKRGTPAFDHWRQRRAARGGVAGRDIGNYNAYSENSWHDEVLVGDQSGTDQQILEQLVDEEGRGSEFTPRGGNVKTSGLTRITAADERNDARSLERKLSRTLYLLVKTKEGEKGQEKGAWAFPSGPLLPTDQSREGLREAAKRVLGETCGRNMNTWFVGAHPVGHWIQRPYVKNVERKEQQPQKESLSPEEETEREAKTEKTFFMKARIFAGQANLASAAQTTPVYRDFKWLTKEEIQPFVSDAYWSRVQDMLVSQ